MFYPQALCGVQWGGMSGARNKMTLVPSCSAIGKGHYPVIITGHPEYETKDTRDLSPDGFFRVPKFISFEEFLTGDFSR